MPTPVDHKYKYITIEKSTGSPSGKTGSWLVWSKDVRICLGYIKWYGAWRTYAFFPGDSTLYEHNCLWDIADFVAKETFNLREMWKKRKIRKETHHASR